MADRTGIEWATASLNPIRARNRETGKVGWYCTHASDGCTFCYAEAMNRRLGTGVDYRAQDEDRVEPFLDEKLLMQPMGWRKPRRIFWGSMTDLFAPFVHDEWLDRIFAVCALTPQHQHLFLTKRADRMREYVSSLHAGKRKVTEAALEIGGFGSALLVAGLGGAMDRGWPGVWLGVSVEDQRRADERIPELLATPAAVRFLSVEPMLGPVTLPLGGRCRGCRYLNRFDGLACEGCGRHELADRLGWVIVGGESGRGARPMKVAWAHSIVEQCRSARVPCFVKQLGANPDWGEIGPLRDRKGGDPEEWPPELRVREFPTARGRDD